MTAITPVLRKREKSRRPSTFLSQQSSPVHQGGSPQQLSPLLDRSRRQSAHSMGSPSVITPAENTDGDTVLQVSPEVNRRSSSRVAGCFEGWMDGNALISAVSWSQHLRILLYTVDWLETW